MPRPTDRRVLPSGLTGLAGVACAACCLVPFLLAAGVLSGAGWLLLQRWLPALAVALAIAAAGAWWWARHRHADGCGRGNCSCATG